MPLGSSSAAPVMRPGPRRLAKPLIWLLIWSLNFTFMSVLPVETEGIERSGAAIHVVARIDDALGVGGEREAGAELGAVVELGHALVAVAQGAVAQERRQAAAFEVLAVRRRDRVGAERQAHGVLVARPAAAL